MPVSIEPKDKTRIQGFFERLVGYERIEYLRDLAGIKDRLYEDAPFRVLVRGTAARPTYIPSQADHRIVGCTGIPADSHDLFWIRVYLDKIERCPECGHAFQAYDYDVYMEEADFVVQLANRLTKGFPLGKKEFEAEYDEWTREDVLNLAEEGPFDQWEALVKTCHQFYREQQQQAANNEDAEAKELQEKMQNNRFINLDGSRIIHGRNNHTAAPCNSSPNKKIGE